MASLLLNPKMAGRTVGILVLGAVGLNTSLAQAKSEPHVPSSAACHVEAADYKGWHVQRLSNRWVELMVLPQNGGRLIQVTFAGHPYLFNNPKYEGKYLPPTESQWFNYGGDKLWLLPEGNDDEQHWVGDSDVIDDGPYSFRKISEGEHCEIELTGPADPRTGIQFQRTIRLDSDSPRISFHATMKNISGHALEWSMQSVSQYDTADPGDPIANQPRLPYVHSGESSQQLSQPLSRPIRPGGKSRGVGQRKTACLRCTMSTWRPSCGWTQRPDGWRWSMAAASTPWSNASNMKSPERIPAKHPSFFGRMAQK